MKKTIDIREKIAVRAYYAWINGSIDGHEADWLAAEAIELAYAERRAASAKKAADTRRANAAIKAPAEMLVATKRKLAGRSPTAH